MINYFQEINLKIELKKLKKMNALYSYYQVPYPFTRQSNDINLGNNFKIFLKTNGQFDQKII